MAVGKLFNMPNCIVLLYVILVAWEKTSNSVLFFEEGKSNLEHLMRNYSKNVEGNIKIFSID